MKAKILKVQAPSRRQIEALERQNASPEIFSKKRFEAKRPKSRSLAKFKAKIVKIEARDLSKNRARKRQNASPEIFSKKRLEAKRPKSRDRQHKAGDTAFLCNDRCL